MTTATSPSPLLPPGHYRVAVEKDGFRRAVLADVGLDVEQTARVDFTLQVGILNEEVQVNDTPPIIQTDTSTLGQVINGRLVHELPLNERNFLSFALLAPGSQLPAEGSQNSTQGGAISVNGAREQSNNFLLEGVDNNDPYINQYVALPSIDADSGVQGAVERLLGRIRAQRRRANQCHPEERLEPVPWRTLRVPAQPQPGRQELLRSALLHARFGAGHLRPHPALRPQPVRRNLRRPDSQGQDFLFCFV